MTAKKKLLLDLSKVPDESWELAKGREAEIRPLVLDPPPRDARREALAKAARNLGLSEVYLYRLMRRYRANPCVESILAERAGPKPGARKLIARVEEIIEEETHTNYLTMNKPNVSTFVLSIHARCWSENLPKPSRKTIERRLALISKKEQMKRRLGAKKAHEKFAPIKGSLVADRPLQIMQMDHTRADVIAIDEETGEVIGRPWLTIATDVYSRMYCGFRLSFDAPSVASVAACLTHAVMDKGLWLEERGLPKHWPVSGLPETIHVDNGKEFHAIAFERACENYGIRLTWRPRRTPRYGGHIERRFRDMAKQLHLLDGTTFSNVRDRGVYDSMGNAQLTLKQIRWIVGSIILEQNATYHEGIGTSPNSKWKEGTAGKSPRMPLDMHTFLMDFLPFEERTVQRDGVHLFGVKYWHEALLPFLENQEKVIVHYDPADLSQVFIRDMAREYIQVRFKNLLRPSISKWELKSARRALRDQGRMGVDEEMIFRMILERRELQIKARGRSSRARLELARNKKSYDLLPPPSKVNDIQTQDADDGDDIPRTLPYYDPKARNG
jgi:putative transposase